MPRRATFPGGVGWLLQRLVPLGALLGGPCCGTHRTQITLSPWDSDAGIPLDGGGVLTPDECRHVCVAHLGVQQVYGCTHGLDSTGHAFVRCDVDYDNCHEASGRRPEGLAATPPPTAGADPIGAWLAESARLEDASVHAFRALHDELAAHDAPAALRRAAARAARDEVRHARLNYDAVLQAGGGLWAPPGAFDRLHTHFVSRAAGTRVWYPHGSVRRPGGILLGAARYGQHLAKVTLAWRAQKGHERALRLADASSAARSGRSGGSSTSARATTPAAATARPPSCSCAPRRPTGCARPSRSRGSRP